MFRRIRSRPRCDILNLPLLVIGHTGIVQDVNQAMLELVSAPKKDIVGLSYHDVEFLKPLEKYISSALLSGRTDKYRYSVRDRHFEASIHPFDAEGRSYVSVCLYDISPFLGIEQELLRRNRELMIINTLSGAFISSEKIDGIFSELLEKVLMITDFTTGWIMFKKNGAFEIKGYHGLSKTFLNGIMEGGTDDLCRNIERMSDPLSVYEEEDLRNIPLVKEEGIVMLAAVPIKTGDMLKGIMFLASRAARAFDFNLASILSLIGSQLTLIIEKIDLFEETRRLSITDSLTGLFNSRYFYQALDKEIARAERYEQVFSLAIFDIDDFKILNDTYGHQAGDEVLRKIAAVLLHESRETDIVARYGGEEFVIIFPNTPKNDALAVAERILKGVEVLSLLDTLGEDVTVTMSGGISSFPDDGSSVNDLLYRADMAMYRAKSSGKKRVVCYNIEHEKDIQKA